MTKMTIIFSASNDLSQSLQIKKNFNSFSSTIGVGGSGNSPGKNQDNPDPNADPNSTNNNNKASEAVRISLR